MKAIAKDATVYRQALISKVKELLNQDPDVGRPLIKALDEVIALDVHLPKNPTLGTISHILDPFGGNVTFRTQKTSERIADNHLAPQCAARAKSLTRNDWLIIRVMVTVRNVLAHSSIRSVDAMNDAMQAADHSGSPQVKALARTGNRVTRSGVGAYLRAAVPGGNSTRIMLICGHMLSPGLKFRVWATRRRALPRAPASDIWWLGRPPDSPLPR